MTSRRDLLLQGLALGAAACTREAAGLAPSSSSSAPPSPLASSAPPAASSAPSTPQAAVETRKLDFPSNNQAAVVLTPTWGAAGERYPLLVALHGLGEARKGVEAGAWGWVRDYWLDRAMFRLRNAPLTVADFQGIYDQKRIDKINASLAERPFRGLVVACPYTPDLLKEKSLDNAGPFASFLVNDLLPRVRGGWPVLAQRERTGIDGVSLGGRLAVLAGVLHPTAFSAVGSLQAALQLSEARPLASRTLAARDKARSLRLRLLTSEKDFYRTEIAAYHRELDRLKLPHEHVVVPGPHDYPFNRGPGAIEMLLWHDRVLRGEEP